MEDVSRSLADKELFENFVRDGREESFDALVQHCKLRLFNVAYGVLYDAHAAEDVVQTVFVNVYAQRNQLANVESPPAWLYRATLNQAINMKKQTRRREDRETAVKPSLNSATPREAAGKTELRRELDAAMAKLKDSLRIPLMLRYLQDLSSEETGKTLGLSPNATRKRVNRGLKALKKLLVRRGIVIPVLSIEAGLRSIPAKAASADFMTSMSSIIKAASTLSIAGKAAFTTTSIVKGITIMTAKAKIATGVIATILVAGTITHLATRDSDEGPAEFDRLARVGTLSQRGSGADVAGSRRAIPEDGDPEEGGRGSMAEAKSNGSAECCEEPVVDGDIAGIVIDSNGNAVEGATVKAEFFSWSDFSPENISKLVTASAQLKCSKQETGEDGRFGFRYEKGKRYMLSAKKEDYIAVHKNMGAPEKDIVLTLSLGGAIEGRVVDAATGEPLETFRIVTTEDTGGKFSLSFFTKREVDIYLPTMGRGFNNLEGTFRVPGLAKGKYRLTSLAEGYAQSDKGGIEVELEKTTAGVVIKQQPAGGVHGQVVDAIGNPIEGAEIVQINPLQSDLIGELGFPKRKVLARSNAKGEFEIGGLPAGTFSLQARHAHYCPEEQKARVNRGEITEGVEFQLLQGGMISGVVLAKTDLQPIAGATVKASTASGFLIPDLTAVESKSDPNGLFDIIGLEPGTYSLSVFASDFAEKSIGGLTLGENDAITDVIVQLSQGGSLVGTVRDLSGKPLGKQMIMAVGPGGQKLAQADEQGNYAISNLKEGNYTAGAMDIESPATPNTGSQRVDMRVVRIENDKETRLDIVIGGPRKVYGVVTLKGEPQAGLRAMVQSSAKSMAATKTTRQYIDSVSEDGRYEIDNLQPGEYSLIVMKMVALKPQPLFGMDIELTNTDLEKNVELPEGGISGEVVDAETRDPIEGATVALGAQRAKDAESAALSKLGMFTEGTERTDSEGKYSFSIVEDSDYFVVASKEGYAPQGLTADIRNSHGPSDLDFSLVRGETLLGQVTGSDPERPIQRIYLTARDSGGRPVFSKTIALSEGGEYDAVGLSPDEYVISVDALGYASASKEVAVRAGADNRADFVLTAGATLTIKVVDERGSPVQGPQVELMDAQGNFFLGFFPDLKELMNAGLEEALREDGVIQNRNLPQGEYRLKVSALGYEDESLTVSVREGEETEETVTLRKSR